MASLSGKSTNAMPLPANRTETLKGGGGGKVGYSSHSEEMFCARLRGFQTPHPIKTCPKATFSTARRAGGRVAAANVNVNRRL